VASKGCLISAIADEWHRWACICCWLASVHSASDAFNSAVLLLHADVNVQVQEGLPLQRAPLVKVRKQLAPQASKQRILWEVYLAE